jgi:hypothetical protein
MMTSGRPPFPVLTRILAVVPALAAFTVVGSATKVGPSIAGCAQAASVHHAALVVEHSDGAVITVCVSFTADSITGDQLLASSGVQYSTQYFGGAGKAVCQIDGEPAQYPSTCWTASSAYWAMFVSRAGGSWVTSSLGISSQTFRDGDAEGFRYEGQSDSSVPPSPHGVCPAPSTPTAARATTPAPIRTGATTHAARPTSTPPSRTPASTPTVASSPTAAPASAAPSRSPTAHAAVAAPGRSPPSQPVSWGTGMWAASGLGAVLLVLLVVQLIRPRRNPSPPRWQP